MYFAKQTHQDILRQKDYDLNFNISYEKFWENHHVNYPKKIYNQNCEDTLLPKETAKKKNFTTYKTKSAK